MNTKKVAVVCGTRPEIIKMAPVYRALRDTPGLEPVLVHTGQHTDLAHPLYRLFDMRVDHDLVLERSKPTLSHLSQRLLETTSEVFEQVRPDAVLVHGDTSSAAMAALAAFYERIPVGHVEAGLRTLERYSPFPEEMNRSLIGRIAHWHYAPTERARQALLRENIAERDILVTGNTVVDAAQLTAQLLGDGASEPFVAAQRLHERCTCGTRLVLVTAHRRENWGEGLRQIAHAVADLLQRHDDWLVVWPLHANPEVARTVRDVLAERGVEGPRLLLTAPLEYTALVWVLSRAWATLTDSGGIQEEAAAFGVPVLVLRESTERPELIEAGGVLTGACRQTIVREASKLADDELAYARMKGIANPFGDGQAARRIAAHLRQQLAWLTPP